MKPDRQALEKAYLEACALDVESFKPGNVSVYSPGHGMRAKDFILGAEVSAPFLCDPDLSLGQKIYQGAVASFDALGFNANLGIVLLAAPLMDAVQRTGTGDVRSRLVQVLERSSREDAEWVYRAIRHVQPGGLGRVGREDVREPPSVTLFEAMKLAKNHDRVAYNYTFSYEDIYERAIPGYHNGVYRWDDERWATVAVFVTLLRRIPDTHVERKHGKRFTGMIQAEMGRLEKTLFETAEPEKIVSEIREIDARFKKAGINPGTTADLTVASLLAVRLEKLMASIDRKGSGGVAGERSPTLSRGGQPCR